MNQNTPDTCRWFFEISYDGSDFHGWQRQKNVNQPTVEQCIEDVLSTLYGSQDIDLIGQGRTDAGVHALAQTAHVDLPEKFEAESLKKALNSLLPSSIRIVNISQVHQSFHARFDAIARSYRYHIDTLANPLRRNLVLHDFKHLNFELMQETATLFEGEHDFSSFCIKSVELSHYRCSVQKVVFFKEERLNEWVFKIKANRFLRRMVRRLVGTLCMVGLGRLKPSDIQELLQNPVNNDPRVFTAKAHPLILEQVYYPSLDR